jgi:agmatinase
MDSDAPASPDAGMFGLETTPEEAGVVLVPVPFEATVSYGGGTSRGPAAILAASHQIDLFDLETGEPWRAGIAMLDSPAAVEAWNAEACALARGVIEKGGVENDPALAGQAAQVDAISEQVNAWVDEQVSAWLARGRLVGVVGGDHSVAYGSIAAHARAFPGLGILHFDAHADLREAYEGFRWSHASVLGNALQHVPGIAAVVGVGFRDLGKSEHELLEQDPRLHPFYDPWLRRRLQEGAPWAELAAEIVAALPEQVYVTFDIDGLDPALCPHTGTPVPGGLSFAEACSLLRAVVDSGRRIVGFDLVEVSPGPEGPEGGEWDANVGARVLYKLIGFALRSRG